MPATAPPHTGAITGVLELLAFLRDPGFAGRRFAQLGDVFETVLAGQPQVFVRGTAPVADLMSQAAALEGWWPASVSELLGPLLPGEPQRRGPSRPATGRGPAVLRRGTEGLCTRHRPPQ